jgi:tRNAThr (cytosine32-N3)-methyltransferase
MESCEAPEVDRNQRGKRKQLKAGMEHLRFAVTVPESTLSTPPDPQESDAYGVPAHFQPIRKPRSDASNNPQKRTDPFQFGSRYLEEGDDIFAYNAWDHVETDEAYKEFAEDQYAKQRQDPVSDFDKST